MVVCIKNLFSPSESTPSSVFFSGETVHVASTQWVCLNNVIDTLQNWKLLRQSDNFLLWSSVPDYLLCLHFPLIHTDISKKTNFPVTNVTVAAQFTQDAQKFVFFFFPNPGCCVNTSSATFFLKFLYIFTCLWGALYSVTGPSDVQHWERGSGQRNTQIATRKI